ncbi:MAG: hypothetical protein HQM08_07235 [Candidatus Riflebacteria bacterium]|nr:hypothetical protein [Candidatus Riflebacteria bacterium]
MRFIRCTLLFLLIALCSFAQTTAGPNFGLLNLDSPAVSLAEKPQWIDATPIFHDMAVEGANKFHKFTGTLKKDGTPIGGEESFWAMNIASKQFEKVTAVLRKIGKNCYIYVEKGQQVEDSTLDAIAQKFDDVIYAKDTTNFGSEPKPGVDGDDRITLLMMDIKDGWEPGKGYVGGYFFPFNEYSTKEFPQSNEREMVYLDMNPSNPKDPEYLGVVAHEFQHLIHWNHDPREDKWVNEGMSQIAFHVCGYPHPSQIMAFAENPNHTLAAWKNTIDDYGAVYLFFYYLTTKYIPSSGILTKEIVADQGKSIAGVNSAITKLGIPTEYAKVFSDWIVANIVSDPSINGGKYGYDSTLPVKLSTHAVFPTATPVTATGSLLPWAAEYYQVTNESFWKPANPTLADPIEVAMPDLGAVVWCLDDGKIPPQTMWPAKTRLVSDGKLLLTKLGQGETFRVGPFTSFPASKLNISVYNSAFIPIDHGQVRINKDSAGIAPIHGKLTFAFKGKKKGTYEIKLVTEGTTTNVTPITLDANNAGTCDVNAFGTDVKRAIVIVGNAGEKDFDYELTTTLAPTQLNITQIAAGLKRGNELIETLKPMVAKNNELLGNLYTSAIQEYSDLLKEGVVKLDPTSNPEASVEYQTLSKLPKNAGLVPLVKILSEKASFGSQHGQAWTKETKDCLDTLISENASEVLSNEESALPTTVRDDNNDTAHTNIIYLTNKKKELIELLTHLKIDPKFLEGQIIQMYKLLSLQLNLPNIPLPNGLGLADYKEETAKTYIASLLQDASATTDIQKESLKRLTVAEELTERLYNDNLTMAEDFGLCLYETARLVLCARETLLSVASGLSNVPGAGPLVKKVVNAIIGKALGIVVRITNLTAVKLKPPYNTIVPIAVQLGAQVAAKALHVHMAEKDSWIKPWAAKTVAKYALTACPKIGYVAKTQESVDAGVPLATANNFNGTYDDAVKAVLDDGNPVASTSIYEAFITNINAVHDLTTKEVEYSKIAKAVAEIAAYATLIDPTNISKVVGVLATAVSGGALGHGMVNSMSNFYKTPEMLANGVQKAFHPGQAIISTDSSIKRVPLGRGQSRSSLPDLDTFYSNYQDLITQAQSAFQSGKVKILADLTDNLIAFEEAVEANERMVSSECEAALAGTKTENELDALTELGVESDMARMDVLSALIPTVMGSMPDGSFTAKTNNASQLMKKRMSWISKILGRSDGSVTPKISIPQTKVVRTPLGWRVTSVVSLVSPHASEITFTLYGAPDTTIISAPSKKLIIPDQPVTVEWLISGSDQAVGMPITISCEANDNIPAIDFTVLP